MLSFAMVKLGLATKDRVSVTLKAPVFFLVRNLYYDMTTRRVAVNIIHSYDFTVVPECPPSIFHLSYVIIRKSISTPRPTLHPLHLNKTFATANI